MPYFTKQQYTYQNFTKLDVVGNRDGDNNSHDGKFTQLPRPNQHHIYAGQKLFCQVFGTCHLRIIDY